MNLLTLKDKFGQELLNLRHIFDEFSLTVWATKLDCEITPGSVISSMNAAPKAIVVVAVVVVPMKFLLSANFGSLPHVLSRLVSVLDGTE